MPSRLSTSVDMFWLTHGDFVLDANTGDLKDTRREQYRDLIQRADTRIRSGQSDWRLSDLQTAGLQQFYGKQNTAELGQDIKDAVFSALTARGFLRPNEVSVEVFPVSLTEVVLIVLIRPAGQRTQIYLNYTYDGRDNKIVPRNL